MKIIPAQTKEGRARLDELIAKRGRTPEHNADWFLDIAIGEDEKPVIVELDHERAVLAYDEGAKWFIVEEPLAAEQEIATTLRDVAAVLFESTPAEKITVELKSELRKELLGLLPGTMRAHAINYTMHWPVYELAAFDPALPGKKWKHMRNARNAFYRDHVVVVKDARDLPKDELHALVDAWANKRPATDRAYKGRYHAAIDTAFAGFESARAFVANGKVVGLNGGWSFPGKPGYYYASVGLHDFSHKDLGAMLYLEDLAWIKERGYEFVDMAGGEEGLSHFKNQFHPAYWYKTHVFSISHVPAFQSSKTEKEHAQ